MNAKTEASHQAGKLARQGKYKEAFALLNVSLPRDIGVFFGPADDGRQDLMYEQDFGLQPFAAEYEAARKAVLAAPLAAAERDLLLGYLDLFLGQYKRAVSGLSRAAAAFPDDFWPSFLHACALWLHGDKARTRELLPDALVAVEKAIAVDPGQLYSYVVRAGLRREMEDVPGRLEDAERVIAMDPDFVWARTEKLEILGETGHYEAALKESDALLERFPKEAWAWAQRGRLRGITGYYKLSLEDFERAVELDPECGPLLAWRGETQRRLGRYQVALADLDRSIQLDPGYRLAHAWRGRVYLLLGRFDEAIRDFDETLRLDPREMLARSWRGEARWKAGDAKGAAADFEAIYPAEPQGFWNARLKESETQEYTFMLDASPEKRLAALWSDLEKGVGERPGDPWTWTFSGRVKIGAGRLEEGITELSRAIELSPLPLAFAWRGEGLRRLGELEPALAELDRAVVLEPSNRWAMAWRGRTLADLGRQDEALHSFSKALEGNRDQRFAVVHAWKGEILLTKGFAAEAAAAFRSAFLLDGKCKEAKFWLKQAGGVAKIPQPAA